MAYDNRIEIARHDIITKNTELEIYLVHPYYH